MNYRFSPSLKLALAFLLFGVTWIIATDLISSDVAQNDSELFKNLQRFKGLFFILISSLLLFFLSKRFYAHIDNANREQEEALKRYNVLGMATNDAIWDLNLKTNECYTNRTLQDTFGYTEDELSDNHRWWDNNLHPEDRDRVIELMDTKLAGGETIWQDEYRFRCNDGSYKTVFDRGFIMRDKNGRAYRVIGAMQDVTAQRALQSKLTDEQIKHKNELTQGVINAQEAERKKLGEELHDNINQLLGVVKLYIDHAREDPPMKEQLLKKSSEYLLQVIEEIRQISRSLIPPTLKDLGLIESLSELIRTIEAARKIEIALNSIGFNEEVLSNEMQLMVYRIVQEQMNNILKHSNATKVLISLQTRQKRVHLQIEDNGIGFDITSAKGGIGFQNIRNRLDVFNGTLHINSSPGNGCKMRVEFEGN